MSTRAPIPSFQKRVLVGVAVLIAAAACSLAPTAQPGAGISVPDGPLMQQLRAAVSDDGAMTHLNALQEIADENGGNRSTGSRGYEASVDYVAGVLRGAGFATDTPTYGSDGHRDRGATGRNVIAQTGTGDPGRVVVVGAHLDSVPEGPASSTTAPGSRRSWRSPPGSARSPRSATRCGSRSSAARRTTPRAPAPTSTACRATTVRRSSST
jgi:hypothetical protein